VVAFLQNACKAWYNFGGGLYITPYWCMLQPIPAESKTPMEDQTTDAVSERAISQISLLLQQKIQDLLLIYSMIVCKIIRKTLQFIFCSEKKYSW
jgi:hypothetical protein